MSDGSELSPASFALDVPSSLKSTSNGADYIIITDRSLLASMDPLRIHREAQGLRVKVVATDDIYDEFSFGRLDPNAIKSFLSYAYQNWVAPAPTYVLLAGDGHIDYRNDFGSGTPNTVPPLLVPFPGFGEAPSDNEFVAVAGGDVFPEMFVGRLPIRTPADADLLVNNIIAYETNPPVALLNQQALFVADNNDPIFQAILNNLQAFVPPSMDAHEAYLPGGDPNNPPTPMEVNATTDAIINGYNEGTLLSIYMGHGNVDLWAKEKILYHNPNPPVGTTGRLDADRLTNGGRQAFMVAMNCINGYFTDLVAAGPGHVDYSLPEEWMRRPHGGAIAAWAPSALGQLSEYDGIAWELFTKIFTLGQTTLGATAVSAVVEAVPVFGVGTDNVRGMIFFGDPATELALDRDADGVTDARENALGSNPLDTDSDEDGLADGVEVVTLLSSPVLVDSDNDGILDGTEAGITTPDAGTNVAAGFFVPDADPNTTTSPTVSDTDMGGVIDGDEDLNQNGMVDSGETDPNDPSDDLGCTLPPPEAQNVQVSRTGGDIVLTWDAPASVPCATYRIYAAADAGFPKSSISPFVEIGTSTTPGFTHLGAGGDGVEYDYLIVVEHPTLGLGPFGAYGQ